MVDLHYKLANKEESIQLDKLLAAMNLAGSGSEARAAIVDGMVTVNGTIENQGRRDIKSGEVVVFNGNTIQVG